jgi:hypothetical protein
MSRDMCDVQFVLWGVEMVVVVAVFVIFVLFRVYTSCNVEIEGFGY